MADLAVEADLTKVLEACASADVVLETFRPGVADRLGIGADALTDDNPSLIYCSISGYGQTGPWRDVPGHDANYLAICGLLDRIGPREHPVQAPIPLADIAAGSMAATAICAALVRRERTGAGAYIDMSMTEAALALQSHVFPAGPLRDGQRGHGVLNGDLACFDVYECGDGRWIAVSAIEPHFWKHLCTLLDLEHLIDMQNDPESQPVIRAELAARLATRSAAEWHELLALEDTCTTQILTMDEASRHEQLVARGAIEPLDPDGEAWNVPASPFVIDGQRT